MNSPPVLQPEINRVTHLGATNASLSYLILQYLSSIGYSVSPQEIASSLKLNPDSVRSRLSKMHSKGLISRPYYGKYELNPRYGVGLSQRIPRFQNLVVVCEGVVGVVSGSVVLLDHELCRVSVVFGEKRGRVSYRVRAPHGVDLVGLTVIHGMVKSEAVRRGLVLGDWEVRMVEQLEDYSGLRLEGLASVTFSDLEGVLVKYYNQSGVRREVRSSQSMSLQSFRLAVQEGLDSATVHRRLNDLEYRMGEVMDTVKVGTRRQLDVSLRVLERLEEKEGSASP